jgi:hypothetical protein
VVFSRTVLSLAPNGLGLQRASLLQRSAVPTARDGSYQPHVRAVQCFQTRAAGSLSVRRVSVLLPASLKF